ncbi:hypothetical protein OIDMADRAFT_45950 [Oidiodendron maius Zn]|uniref:MHYT domain-containing protein n=1 Tax=Oidiodendron maius (strain Zn) TaxID=913774 RepID=A0A0C3GTU2_OIDMZ|nr:hypothetical protein OIDMADRAFT_45950 [Oidiodendron maius Zn]
MKGCIESNTWPVSFRFVIVRVQYLVIYVGTWTTLELFNQRTAGRGLYNWSLLFGSAISMGGIAIWCTHYIGNRAIVLARGQEELQIAYGSGFTVLSFFIPIIVLLAAFTAVGSGDRVSFFRVSVGGTLAGSAICGMHYLGQAGIWNYAPVVVALLVFFVLRATWTNSWWKRALCAIILAGAVSGMHWLASVGTEYRLKRALSSAPSSNISRNATVIVVIVLTIGACLVLLVFTMLAQRRKFLSANRGQHVVLASAVFDKNGRIMVTPEGLLPNRKVTSAYVARVFRATRNWSSVSSLIPAMRTHLGQKSIMQWSRLEILSDIHTKVAGGNSEDIYSLVFRELFCVAAADISEALGKPLEKVGILFDQILNTGQPTSAHKRPMHLEGGTGVVRADGRAIRWGYRFTETQNVAQTIAGRMQINSKHFKARLNNMYEYTTESKLPSPGIHLACFAIRATVGGGFDVLVSKEARSQLPTVKLPFDSLNKRKIDYLSKMDGLTVSACSKFLAMKSANHTASKEEQNFAAQFLEGLNTLGDEMSHPLFSDALLIARPVSMPSTMTAFRLMLPIQSRAVGEHFEFSPLGFFRLQQYEYRNGSHEALFSRAIYREFWPLLMKDNASIHTAQRSMKSPTFLGRAVDGLKSKRLREGHMSFDVPIPTTRNNSDSSSERKLVDAQGFGGIMVSQEVSVDITDSGYGEAGAESNEDLNGVEILELSYTEIESRDLNVSLTKTHEETSILKHANNKFLFNYNRTLMVQGLP